MSRKMITFAVGITEYNILDAGAIGANKRKTCDPHGQHVR